MIEPEWIAAEQESVDQLLAERNAKGVESSESASVAESGRSDLETLDAIFELE